jgi:hypothetical protein
VISILSSLISPGITSVSPVLSSQANAAPLTVQTADPVGTINQGLTTSVAAPECTAYSSVSQIETITTSLSLVTQVSTATIVYIVHLTPFPDGTTITRTEYADRTRASSTFGSSPGFLAKRTAISITSVT